MNRSPEDILAAIPHRPPFRFLDELLLFEPPLIRTVWTPDPSAFFFQGHFPGNPIVPGALLCEACFQAGALFMALTTPTVNNTSIPVVTRIQDARFRRIVRPGQRLTIDVTISTDLGDAVYFTGRVRFSAADCARVDFACMSTPPDDPTHSQSSPEPTRSDRTA